MIRDAPAKDTARGPCFKGGGEAKPSPAELYEAPSGSHDVAGIVRGDALNNRISCICPLGKDSCIVGMAEAAHRMI